jgi:DNA-binding transcriptional LysR family regulator
MNAVHAEEAPPELLARLDLNLVVAFDALVREQNVTKAAARVGVTQSAMSHALRRLREMIGDPLLVRGKAGLMLTPRAEALSVPLRSALVTIHRALAGPGPFDPKTATRTFAIASPDLFDVLALPPLFERVREIAPGVDLTVSALESHRLADRLETGELDIAVVPHVHDTSRSDGRGLVGRTLFRDGFACFLRADHPALLRKKKLRLAQLSAASHVMVSPEGAGPGLVDRALAQQGLSRRVALRVPSFVSALEIVRRSDLVLTAPTALRRLAPDLAMVAPPLVLPEHSVDIVWHERFAHDLGHRWLRELLVAVGDTELGDLRPRRR